MQADSGNKRQLVLGPAGCGKSRLLRQAFVEAVRENGGGTAGETLLLVPTASYRDHTRNLVLREGRIGGFPEAGICTFPNLLSRLAPGCAGPELNPARRELLIRRLLGELALSDFQAVADFPGFRAALGDAVEEVRRAGLTPEKLKVALATRDLAGRHHCFLRFLEAYNAALEQAGIDEDRRLIRALDAIAADALPLRLLLVDGFTDFTIEQRQLLAALLRTAPAAKIALTFDPQNKDLFYQAEHSRSWLKPAGFEEVWIDGNHRTSRVSLAAVERAIRAVPPGGISERSEATVPAPAGAGGTTGTEEPAIAIFAAADRPDEAELIGREVLRLVRGGLQYRDIGIIVNQPAEYAPLLRGVFRRLGIPLRAFVRISLAGTAYGRHLRLCLDLLEREKRPESIFRWLKSPYCTIRSRWTVEKFEYRAVERLAAAREGRWDAIEQPETVMAGLLKRLHDFDRELEKASAPVDLAALVGRLWRELTRRDEIPDGVSAERALELRAEAEASRVPDSLLEEVVEAARAENIAAMSFADFRDLLLRLMAEEQFEVRDRRQDAVNLLNTLEARQWELGAVFVAGLVEKEFPAAQSEALFLDDEDRRAIEGTHSLPLPTSADRARDQRLLFYVAATRARERLYFTYPQADSAGKALLRSFFLRGLDPLLKSPACRVLKRRRSEIVGPVDMAAGEPDLLAITHAELARWPERRELGRALALYEKLRAGGATSRASLALAPRPSRLQAEAALARLREQALRFSASGLRTFAECAFKYFAEESLGLQGPPAPKELDFKAQGNIVHAAIEEWERGGGSEPISEALNRCFEKVMKDEGIPPSHQGARIREEMRRCLMQFAEAEKQHDAVYRTATDPQYTELKFGGRGGEPPLKVPLPDGVVVEVAGRIDRVESVSTGETKLGLVVDYKYSSAGFDEGTLQKIHDGLDLQLPIYLLALETLFQLTPAGAEIYPLKDDDLARCGIYDGSLASHLFSGALPETAITLAPESFRGLITEGRRWIERHAVDIRNGEIAVMGKAERNCKNCEFFDLCRVTPWAARKEREQVAAQ